jgi:hypothetical protein
VTKKNESCRRDQVAVGTPTLAKVLQIDGHDFLRPLIDGETDKCDPVGDVNGADATR